MTAIDGDHLVDVFQPPWSPCTGTNSIGFHLNQLQFPITFRHLRDRWISQGRPKLAKLECPDGVLLGLSGESLPIDLEDLKSLQKIAVLSTVAGYLQACIIPPLKRFDEVASYIRISASIQAELSALQLGCNQEEQEVMYEENWRECVANLDRDRASCLALAPHDCLMELLWGEVATMSTDTILTRYAALHTTPCIPTAPSTSSLSSPLMLCRPTVLHLSTPASLEQESAGLVSGTVVKREHSEGEDNASSWRSSLSTASPPVSVSSDKLDDHLSSNIGNKRAEQNRRKSKRYHGRRKYQRHALRDIMLSFEATTGSKMDSDVATSSRFCPPPLSFYAMETVQGSVISDQSSTDSSLSDQNLPFKVARTANERKKVNKSMQKEMEATLMEGLSRIAERLLPLSNSQPLLRQRRQALGLDGCSQLALLQIWVRHRHQWLALIDAEARLSVSKGRPVARLIGSFDSRPRTLLNL